MVIIHECPEHADTFEALRLLASHGGLDGALTYAMMQGAWDLACFLADLCPPDEWCVDVAAGCHQTRLGLALLRNGGHARGYGHRRIVHDWLAPCRRAAAAMFGLASRDVAGLLARAVWGTRYADEWQSRVERPHKKMNTLEELRAYLGAGGDVNATWGGSALSERFLEYGPRGDRLEAMRLLHEHGHAWGSITNVMRVALVSQSYDAARFLANHVPATSTALYDAAAYDLPLVGLALMRRGARLSRRNSKERIVRGWLRFCRRAAVAMFGLATRDVAGLLARAVWATRYADEWHFRIKPGKRRQAK
jgi:hypothetical protein